MPGFCCQDDRPTPSSKQDNKYNNGKEQEGKDKRKRTGKKKRRNKKKCEDHKVDDNCDEMENVEPILMRDLSSLVTPIKPVKKKGKKKPDKKAGEINMEDSFDENDSAFLKSDKNDSVTGAGVIEAGGEDDQEKGNPNGNNNNGDPNNNNGRNSNNDG